MKRITATHAATATYAVLVLIMGLGAFLRFYHLPQNPPGFFCDEATEGYNALHIAQSLRDEYGVRLPAFFRALGDWRGGAFIYLCVPAVKLFGLSELAVRGTAAAIGVLTILFAFLLAKEIFNRGTGLLAALFLAICPWHFFFSRVGFQFIALPLFFTAALYFFFRAMNGKRPKTSFCISGACFALSIYTYFSPRMFIPVFLVVLMLMYAKRFLRMKREAIIFIASVLVFSIPYMQFFFGHREKLTSRFKQVSIFKRKATPTEYARIISGMYFETLSYRFLFKEGDRWDRSEVRGFGPLLRFQLPFIILGVAAFAWQRKKPQQVLLVWLLLLPVPGALVGNRASVARNILAVPLFPLIAAHGTTLFFSFLRRMCARPFPDSTKTKSSPKRFRAVAVLLLQYIFVSLLRFALYAVILIYIVAATYFSVNYFTAYFKDYPLYAGTSWSGWQYGPEEVFAYINQVYDEYDEFSWQVSGGPTINRLDTLAKFYLHDNSHKFNMKGFSRFDPNKKQLFIVYHNSLTAFGPGNYRVHKEFLAPDGSPLYLAIQFKNSPIPPAAWLTSPLYDNSEGKGFDKPYPPETEGHTATVPWKMMRSSYYGFIHLRYKLRLPPRENFKCLYLLLYVESPEQQFAQLRVGATDSLKLWFNSELLLERRGKHVGKLDDSIVPVELLPGTNTILVKSCLLQSPRWDIFLRLTDEEGNNIDNLTYRVTP